MQLRRWLAFVRASTTFLFVLGIPCSALILGAACGSKSPGPNIGDQDQHDGGTGSTGGGTGGTGMSLKVSVTPSEVLADGANAVAISVSGAQGSITLSTDRGSFQGSGAKVATLDPGATAATLVTCDSRQDAACAGKATITVVDSANNTKITSITFDQGEICDDGIDNDGDQLTDCADTADCVSKACRVGGAGADSGIPATGMCSPQGQCVCGAGLAEICTDGMDNNCDDKIDCADSTCAGQRCLLPTTQVGGLCIGGQCTCPKQPEDCANNVDDDCDGLVDCADPDCQKEAGVGGCAGQGSNLLSITADKTLLPADGTSTVTVTASLRNSVGSPQANQAVTFTLDSGSVGSLSPTTAMTNSAGIATTTFTASSTAGAAVIRASAGMESTAAMSNTVTISMPVLGQLVFVKQDFAIMGNRGSNFNETNQITFQVLYSNGTPYPPGLVVTFTHTSEGGSFLGVTDNCVNADPDAGTTSRQCTVTGVTDIDGKVTVLLHSGDTAAHLSVTASATAGGNTVTASATNINVVGGKASGLYIAVKCTPYNVPALVDSNCTTSRYEGPPPDKVIDCTTTLADRFNAKLNVAAQVALMSEAGHPDTPKSTFAVDDPNRASAPLGQVDINIGVLNGPVPIDVDPFPGEFAYSYQDSQCPTTHVHNPRDGLVTIIASAPGEEGFVDGSNGKAKNGRYDLGEDFLDIGEPYVDANDNNVRDESEPYIDANTNGKWDGPNGVWDANTTIWSSTRVLYSGQPAYLKTGQTEYLSRWVDPASPPPNASTKYAFSMQPNQSAIYSVYFADLNFNVLSSFATFSATEANGTGEATEITGAANFLDDLGMIAPNQFCDSPTGSGAGCHNDCEAAPCYAVTQVSNFANGGIRNVRIKCPSTLEPSETVYENVTLAGVITTFAIDGACQ